MLTTVTNSLYITDEVEFEPQQDDTIHTYSPGADTLREEFVSAMATTPFFCPSIGCFIKI